MNWKQNRKSKSLRWVLGFMVIPGVIEAFVEAFPAFAQPVYEPICYIQTANGQVVDLTHLCARNAEASRAQPSSHQQIMRPVRRGRNAARRPL